MRLERFLRGGARGVERLDGLGVVAAQERPGGGVEWRTYQFLDCDLPKWHHQLVQLGAHALRRPPHSLHVGDVLRPTHAVEPLPERVELFLEVIPLRSQIGRRNVRPLGHPLREPDQGRVVERQDPPRGRECRAEAALSLLLRELVEVRLLLRPHRLEQLRQAAPGRDREGPSFRDTGLVLRPLRIVQPSSGVLELLARGLAGRTLLRLRANCVSSMARSVSRAPAMILSTSAAC